MAGNRSMQTADRILDVAEELVQVRGYNAFSYADVAAALGIQKASLHHHYASKEDLGMALLERYRRRFLEALREIESECGSATGCLDRYVRLYADVLHRGRMCMCGMLAADIETLPRSMRRGIEGFFAENAAWLTRVLEQGKARGDLLLEESPAATATFIVSSLEGALLVARANGRPRQFDHVARLILRRLRPEPGPKPRSRAR